MNQLDVLLDLHAILRRLLLSLHVPNESLEVEDVLLQHRLLLVDLLLLVLLLIQVQSLELVALVEATCRREGK